jgi:hypothetical protein
VSRSYELSRPNVCASRAPSSVSAYASAGPTCRLNSGVIGDRAGAEDAPASSSTTAARKAAGNQLGTVERPGDA